MRRLYLELSLDVHADCDLTPEEWEEVCDRLTNLLEKSNPTKDLFHIDGYVTSDINHKEMFED